MEPVLAQVMVVVAVLAAAATVLLGLPGPPRRPRPHGGGPARHPTATRSGASARWVRILRGRTDGVGSRARLLGAAAVAVATAMVGQVLGLPAAAAWLVAAVAAAGAGIGAGWIEDPAIRRRYDRVTADLPATCDLLVACLAAGLPLRRAAEVVAQAVAGPVAEDLRHVLGLVGAGEHEPVAWRSLAAESPPWRRLGVDLARSAESGTAVTETLHEHARLAREAAEAAQERSARTAGVRSVLPLMVCFLPAFFLVGVVPIVAGLVLDLLGS